MKLIRTAATLIVLSTVAFIGIDAAQACGCRARDRASAYCETQRRNNVECEVRVSGNGCAPGFRRAQIFVDETSAYAACTR